MKQEPSEVSLTTQLDPLCHFNYTARVNGVLSPQSSVSLTVLPVNDPPKIFYNSSIDSPPQHVEFGQVLEIRNAWSISDPDMLADDPIQLSLFVQVTQGNIILQTDQMYPLYYHAASHNNKPHTHHGGSHRHSVATNSVASYAKLPDQGMQIEDNQQEWSIYEGEVTSCNTK